MTKKQKTQTTLLLTAAIAGLVAGTVAKAQTTNNGHVLNAAGKQALGNTTSLNGCGGCGGKTSTNSVSSN